jgi:membrane protein DedA with SNARE-associated domain
MSKLEYPTFIAYAWTGGALWVATFLTLGYFLGENWRPIAELVQHYIAYASAVFVSAAVLWYILWKKRGRKTARTKP